MSLKEAILLGLALNFIAGGVIGFLTGPKGFLISIGIGFALLIVVYVFFHNRGLVIHYAGHGIGPEQYEDVTVFLRGHIRNNMLNVVIDGTTFPHDPYPGQKKHVLVRYSYRSRTIREKVKHEGDRLMLP
jgi:hypothetical protein